MPTNEYANRKFNIALHGVYLLCGAEYINKINIFKLYSSKCSHYMSCLILFIL